MFKFLTGLMGIALSTFPAIAQTTNDNQQIAAVRAAIQKLGKGTNATVQVTRRGKPKVKGFIKQIYEDSFEVVSTENGSTIDIPYSEVVKVKGKGVDWKSGGAAAGVFGLKALKVMGIILKGTCLGPISRCSP